MTLNMAPDYPLLLTPAEVALLLDVDVRQLREWRDNNAGPAFHELGKGLVRYSRASVAALRQSRPTSRVTAGPHASSG